MEADKRDFLSAKYRPTAYLAPFLG